jgi:putative FmdB family regulatory protein
MPIYEYRCADCGRKTSILTLGIKSVPDVRCPYCGGTNLTKLVSRVAVLRSEDSRLESLADPAALSGLDENDPRSVARWMKRMGREMGDDAGEDFEEEIERAVEDAEGGEGSPGTGGGSDDDF